MSLYGRPPSSPPRAVPGPPPHGPPGPPPHGPPGPPGAGAPLRAASPCRLRADCRRVRHACMAGRAEAGVEEAEVEGEGERGGGGGICACRNRAGRSILVGLARGRAAHCREPPAAAAFYMGAAGMHAVGLMTKAFVVAPLAAFAAIVFGFAVYNTVCKNSHINLLNC